MLKKLEDFNDIEYAVVFLGALWRAVVVQGYGLTETTARVFGAVGPEETRVEGANGKLMPNIEAKIVEAASETGIGLPPLMQGEIWVRGPCIMKGNVGFYTSDIEGERFTLNYLSYESLKIMLQ